MHWTERKAWADGFDAEIRSILRDVFNGEPVKASKYEDINENTDYIVGDRKISVRIRRDKYRKYENEITFRLNVPSGNRSEFDKMLSGLGDYMLYAFADPTESRIAKWTIIDLAKMRESSCQPSEWKSNRDGSSDFVVFKLDSLPPGIVYKASNSPVNGFEGWTQSFPTSTPPGRETKRPRLFYREVSLKELLGQD